jgi:hypothetical protein
MVAAIAVGQRCTLRGGNHAALPIVQLLTACKLPFEGIACSVTLRDARGKADVTFQAETDWVQGRCVCPPEHSVGIGKA